MNIEKRVSIENGVRYHEELCPARLLRGRYVSAKCDGRRVTSPYDHALGTEDNHRAAADRLIETMGWNDSSARWVGGSTRRGYFFVQVRD